MVAHVRRVTGEKRVGHAGTLDPAASGVLPVAVGHATKMLPFLEDDDKTYVAWVRFGLSTDSGDRDGRMVARQAVPELHEATLRAAIQSFEGPIEQTPPMHSAIKIDGRRLYDLAREGVTVAVPSRSVTVHEIELITWESPDATLRVRCSKGTYIRSIARDLGQQLKTPAMLANLVRVKAGSFSLSSSLAITELGPLLSTYGWQWVASHPADAAAASSVVVLSAEEEQRWHNGMDICRSGCEGMLRVYDSEKRWIGVGTGHLHSAIISPKRVIRRSDS